MAARPNPLLEIRRLGQSVWYDNIRRDLLKDGTLKGLIEQDGVSGLTSNPSIFDKAVASSPLYDEALRALPASTSPEEAFEAVAVEDIRAAADLLRPVWEKARGADGHASLEVSPLLARDPLRTAEEARRLWRRVDRPNLMVKIPGTAEGLDAIETCLGEGININVTLLFNVERYRQVVERYVSALEARTSRGLPLDVASVASFFVSRVDTLVDSTLQERLKAEPGKKALLEPLLGKAAVANAKAAYQVFGDLGASPRWKALAAQGARPQRLLWASTSAKDPRYRDVMYAEELIGPDTVDTMPPSTIEAFRDHGRAALSLGKGREEARAALEALALAGVDLAALTRRLEDEGVKAFEDSYRSLLKTVAVKLSALAAA